MHWYTVLMLSACYAFDVRHDAIRGAVWCPADDARYTAIEPPLELIKCVTTEDTRHDGLDHPPEP